MCFFGAPAFFSVLESTSSAKIQYRQINLSIYLCVHTCVDYVFSGRRTTTHHADCHEGLPTQQRVLVQILCGICRRRRQARGRSHFIQSIHAAPWKSRYV